MPQILVDLRSQFRMIQQKPDDAFDFVAEATTESGQTCFVASSCFVQFELRVRMRIGREFAGCSEALQVSRRENGSPRA